MAERWEFSEAVIGRARAGLARGAVRHDPDRPTYYQVESATSMGKYHLHTDADPEAQTCSWMTCSCKHGRNAGVGGRPRCWHAVAVLLVVRERLGTRQIGEPA